VNLLATALLPLAVAAQAPDDDAVMRAFLVALVGKDEQYLLANVHPQVSYDSAFRTEHVSSRLEEQTASVIRKTRKCDVGAIMRGGSLPVYTVNWWCKYQDGAAAWPLEGAAAVLSVRDGKIEIGKFNWQGPFSPPPTVRN
jgi:hypothetical protein